MPAVAEGVFYVHYRRRRLPQPGLRYDLPTLPGAASEHHLANAQQIGSAHAQARGGVRFALQAVGPFGRSQAQRIEQRVTGIVWQLLARAFGDQSTQQRGGAAIPVGAPLKAMLDATPRQSPIILVNSEGKPWTSDGFRASWRKACAAAGITGVTFNDLRGTAVTRLA